MALPQYEIDVDGGVWPALQRMAAHARAAGLDAVWLSDHPFAVGPDGVPSGALEPFVSAAALTRAVPGIDVGTLVLAATMRAPALVAHAARTIGPAFILGLGAGWYEAEHRAFGIPLPPYGERIARAGEVVDSLEAAGGARPRV
ncbi:MAG: LLM class flavin-dependent oxidoreductase, partial [Actinomycetota bacterium]